MTCSLAKVDEFKEFIAEILDIDPSLFHIIDIKDGCVTTTYLIPTSVAKTVFSPNMMLSSEQRNQFKKTPILWMKCNGLTFDFQTNHTGMQNPLI